MKVDSKDGTTTRVRVVNRVVRHDTSQKDASTQLLQDPLVRIWGIELPFLVGLFVIFTLLQSALYIHHTFLHPYLKSLKWTDERIFAERTYPAFDCNESAITLRDANHIFLNESSPNAVDFVMEHGGAVFSDLISRQDATRLREYLLNRPLATHERLPVIANTKRRSVALSALEDDSIPPVLESISTNPLLQGTLEGLLGPNPALLAFSTIIAQEGAADQNYHVDKPPDGSAMQFAATFIPNYALLIPLQDTNASMGPTALCPGTHYCNTMNRTICEQGGGFPVLLNDTKWPSGYGLLYHAQVLHRGGAHWQGPPRVALILTFGSRRADTGRIMPLLSYFALKWDMWGFCLRDLMNVGKYMSMSWLRPLALYKDASADWGWTAVDDACSLFADVHHGKLGASMYARLQEKWWVRLIMIKWSEEKDDADENAPYEAYLVALLRRARLAVLSIWIGAFVGYVTLIRNVVKHPNVCVMRIVTLCLLVSIAAVFGVGRLHSSGYWNQLPTKPPQLQLPVVSNDTLVRPEYSDVLVSSALQNHTQLYAYSRVLDFHDGNKAWRAAAERHAADYSLQPDKVATQVISETNRRFLQQMEGGWIQIKHSDILRATHVLMTTLLENKNQLL